MIKLPIAGAKWTMKTDDGLYGGTFNSGDAEIIIGTNVPAMIPTILLHEILEAIITERGCRYKHGDSEGNNGMMFCFNHKEFEGITRDLALALDGFLVTNKLTISRLEDELARRLAKKKNKELVSQKKKTVTGLKKNKPVRCRTKKGEVI